MTRSEIIYEKLLSLPLGAEVVLEGFAEGAQEDTEEPNTEEVEVELNKLESESNETETKEEESPDLVEETLEEVNGK